MDTNIVPIKKVSEPLDVDSVKSLPNAVGRAVSSAVERGQRTVVMTCGSSGSGKSTLAKSITAIFPSFIRLSIDRYIFEHHGVHGKDFHPDKYGVYQEEAEAALKEQLRQILAAGSRDLVLDYSFWSKGTRDEYRDIVDVEGGGVYQTILVFFRATEETLWSRIEKRETKWQQKESEGRAGDGDPEFKVTRDLLKSFIRGFEVPKNEGEIVVLVE